MSRRSRCASRCPIRATPTRNDLRRRAALRAACRSAAATAAGAALLSGCAPASVATPAAGGLDGARRGLAQAGPGTVPQHVVVIVQENRSFDDLFQGYPGANTVASGKNSKGKTIALQAVPLEATYGIDHSSSNFFAACDGSSPGRNCKMDGFDQETVYGTNIPSNPQYGYVPATESRLYFQIAANYVLGDDMFTSHIDASFVSHQYIIAGQANSAVDLPTTLWGCGGTGTDTVATLKPDRSYGPAISPCFDSRTIADELDARHLTWHYYAPAIGDLGYDWSGFQAIKHVYQGAEWKQNVSEPPTNFLKDIMHGTLANVTWVTPTCVNSDHASCDGNTGPQWVATVINAIGESRFWNSTTVFVMWDEWGGWYDHVPPPYVDYDGLGMRVPLLVVSPYAKKGYVSHVQYEHGSILRYIEDAFDLPRLAASDTRANSPAEDAFDYTQPPRPFVPFATKKTAQDFIADPADPRMPDEE